MSDNWLHIIPMSPDFVPAPGGPIPRALAYVRGVLPASDEIETKVSETPKFFDPGSNWSGVSCPSCGADLENRWPDHMSEAYDTGDLTFVADCCGTRLSLDELDYTWPCGFARFSISARNPNVAIFPENELEELARILGTQLRLVWQHL